MKPVTPFRRAHLLTAFACALAATSCRAEPATEPAPTKGLPAVSGGPGQWKTAFYKRGFVGVYQAGWASGVNSTLRLRVPIPFDGTKVRVTLAQMRDGETVLSKMTLAKAKDSAGAIAGTIEGTPRPFLFDGAPGVSIPANAPDVVSDATEGAVARGIWYLQESYSSEKYLYAYHNDGFFNEAGDKHEAATLKELKGGSWPGNVTRIEVFTTDTRPTVLCYGDSITAGYSSTPNAGASYPEVLGRLARLPTLNLGVNGDVIVYTGGVAGLVKTFNGVEAVIVLMGINDIISGRIKDVDAYARLASSLVDSLKRNGKKVFLGTLPPASGYKDYDKDPAKEVLRLAINEWIRTKSGADAVIDFESALADPADKTRMKAEYQSDWLHPSDAGYAKMAETAAKVVLAAFPPPPEQPAAAPVKATPKVKPKAAPKAAPRN